MKAGLEGMFGGNQPAKREATEAAPTKAQIDELVVTVEVLHQRTGGKGVADADTERVEDRGENEIEGANNLDPEEQVDLRNLLAKIRRPEDRGGLTWH